MKIFKFGGASVKDAEAVKNVQSILDRYRNEKLIVVISAMGKTTNAMENIAMSLYEKNFKVFDELIEERRQFHLAITNELFDEKNHQIFDEVNEIFSELSDRKQEQIAENYDFEYDQIVSLGEVISTKIVNAYLGLNRKDVAWADSRRLVRTNHAYRAAEVDWEKTEELIQEFVTEHSSVNVIITQGFLGHTDENFTTTLGREGSDFTAGIFAYCTNAESVTIWKDVSGMLNADPKWFDNTVKLDTISFKEAIELAYFGASVIHPKTIKPLQNKNIPLFVKSFVDPEAPGTVIQNSTENDHLIPSFIFKINQVLLSITPKDFSFIVEENLSDIFAKLAISGGHINIMQNSAVSFTVCLDIDVLRLNKLMDLLGDDYVVKYNNGLELVTIRHYDQATIDRVTAQKEILMEQKTRQTARIVMKSL